MNDHDVQAQAERSFSLGEAAERARIRRSIAPALRELRARHGEMVCGCRLRAQLSAYLGPPPEKCPTCEFGDAIDAIDRATRRARAKPKRQPGELYIDERGVLNAQPMTKSAMRKFEAELKAIERARGGSK